MKHLLTVFCRTVDGANIEIAEGKYHSQISECDHPADSFAEVGEENIFMFGNLVHDVEDLRHARRYRNLPLDPNLQLVVNDIMSGTFGDPRIFEPLIATLTIGKDYYLNSDDFQSYLDVRLWQRVKDRLVEKKNLTDFWQAIELVDAAYKNRKDWIKRTVIAVSRMGKFSRQVL